MPQVLPHISQGPKATLNSPVHVMAVHHGSLHNQQALQQVLQDRGYSFKSQSDTEVIAHLIDAIHQGQPAQPLHRAMGLLAGPVAMGVMFHDQPERLFAVQRDAPLYWSKGPEHGGWSSEKSALLPGASALNSLRTGNVLEIYPHKDGVSHRLHV
jgi:glucosamine--fructose-6-phosphate aminotransferase (isomerizing)